MWVAPFFARRNAVTPNLKAALDAGGRDIV